MARYLLLPATDSKASLEATRGRHAKARKIKGADKPAKGKAYLHELRLTLADYEDTLPWRTRSEFFTLAALYLEGRPKGKVFDLANSKAIARLAMSVPGLPDIERLRILRIAAAPTIASGLSQDCFLWMSKDPKQSKKFTYDTVKFLEYVAFVAPLFERLGKSTSAVISDFLVHSWFEYHKDMWDVSPDVYEHNVNVMAWTNNEKQEFIADLVRSDRHNQFSESKLGLVPSYLFESRAAELIHELAGHLNVNLRAVEVGRIFHGVIDGSTAAKELPTHTTVWRGVKDTAFKEAVEVVLKSNRLLDLASPQYCLEALTGKTPLALTQEMCHMSFEDELLVKLEASLKDLGMDLKALPLKGDYKFPELYGTLVDSTHEYRYRYSYTDNMSDKDKAALARFSGLGSVVFMMLDHTKLHAHLTEYVNGVLLTRADRRLDQLVSDNAEHLKNIRELYHHVTSRTEDDYAATKEHGITLTSFDQLQASKVNSPKIVKILVKLLRAELRNRIAHKLSDVLDSDWKVIASTAVSFDD